MSVIFLFIKQINNRLNVKMYKLLRYLTIINLFSHRSINLEISFRINV